MPTASGDYCVTTKLYAIFHEQIKTFGARFRLILLNGVKFSRKRGCACVGFSGVWTCNGIFWYKNSYFFSTVLYLEMGRACEGGDSRFLTWRAGCAAAANKRAISCNCFVSRWETVIFGQYYRRIGLIWDFWSDGIFGPGEWFFRGVGAIFVELQFFSFFFARF